MITAIEIPQTVEIGPFTYDISIDPADIDALGASLFAAIDPTSLLIALEPAQDQGQMRDSLLHEILHGTTFVAGLDVDIEPEVLEDVIRRMSPILLGVLRDNPDLVSFLVAP